MMVFIVEKRFALPSSVGWRWPVVALLMLLSSCVAVRAVASEARSAVCRIYNQLNGQQNIGSGTLVDRTRDGRQGLVLTCAHLFGDGVGDIVVDFPGKKSHGAKLVGIDHQADLAALVIANPSSMPVSISSEVAQAASFYACGYGSDGQYRCAVGAFVGQASAPGQMSLLIGKGVRSGDSGGGVFDNRGNLVAVVWGESQGVTYASYGRPLRQFLDRMRGQPTANASSCREGVCPQPQQPLRRRQPERNKQPPIDDPRWPQLQAQIDRLRKEKQDRGDYVLRTDIADLARTEEIRRIESEGAKRHAGLIERIQALGQQANGVGMGRAAGMATVGLLGLSGPAGWGVLAAMTVGGWWLGSRGKRKANGARGRRRRAFLG